MRESLHLNFVTEPEPGWILRRLAHGFARHLPNARVSTAPRQDCDANIYVNYALYGDRTYCDVGFFTHRDTVPPFDQVFDRVAGEVDWCIAMCERTARLLPEGKTTVIAVGPDDLFYKGDVVLGVVGREYASGRKRFARIPALRGLDGIAVRVTNGGYRLQDLPQFYREIDYLLVLSDNEGGPIPVLEALAMGKPVIAPNVGFCWDYPVLRYEGEEELHRLLRRLVVPRDSWAKAGSQLEKVVSLVLQQKHGTSRA